MSIVDQMIKGEGFTPSEIQFIESKFKTVSFKKGDVILKAGDQTTHQYYVHEGCLRTFFIDYSGKEHTLQFAVKDWWISDYTAFFSAGKAMMNIECIQNTTLYRLSRKDMEELYIEIPAFETFFRKKLEKRMEAFHRRTLDNLAFSAKKRYLSFIKTYPRIEQSVRNYHIAYYLGMTTESLSRIRKEVAD